MLAAVRSATLIGVDGQPVTVEVHVSSGLPAYQVVGLPDAAVRESREHVRAAVLSSGLEWPQRRITVNLAPGGVRKTGSGLELAVALGVLGANDALPAGVLDGVAVLGRARARRVGATGAGHPGAGRRARPCAACDAVIVPLANASEADLVGDVRVRAARTLGELRACLKGEEPWPDWDPPVAPPDDAAAVGMLDDEVVDLADVRGLPFARQALEVAAAGGHHLLFCGPPGTGKTMLARRLGTILPPLSHPEALEVTRIHSAAGVPARRTARAQAPVPRPAPHRVHRRARRRRERSRPTGRDHARAPRASCSSTSSASSPRRRSTRCANRSRSARCASRARASRSPSPPRSNWWRAPTRARAARAATSAGAVMRNASGTADG